jgi:hypothetical protein
MVDSNHAHLDSALEVHLPPTFEHHLQSLTYPQGDAQMCHLISCHSPINPKKEKKTKLSPDTDNISDKTIPGEE